MARTNRSPIMRSILTTFAAAFPGPQPTPTPTHAQGPRSRAAAARRAQRRAAPANAPTTPEKAPELVASDKPEWKYKGMVKLQVVQSGANAKTYAAQIARHTYTVAWNRETRAWDVDFSGKAVGSYAGRVDAFDALNAAAKAARAPQVRA